MIVGGAVGGEGECSLGFVKENLDEHIVILRTATVEDDLQIGTHGEHTAAPPSLGLEFVEVIGFEVVAVNPDKAYQRQQHRLVAETQLGAWAIEFNAAIGIGYYLTEQMTLTVGLATAIELAGAVLDVPQGIIYLPHAVELVGIKQLHQSRIAVVADVELEQGHLHQIVVEVFIVYKLLDDIGVLEDELHQATVAKARLGIGTVGFSGLRSHIVTA